MGRKSVPTAKKEILGNPGRRPLSKTEPKPKRSLPFAPSHLSSEAVEEWARVVVSLHRCGIVTEIDRAALGAYCQAYGRWAQAEKALAKMAERDGVAFGLMIKTTNGNVVQNPLVGAANKSMSDMVRYAAEFGMTPSARTRINASDEPEDDPADKFLN